MNCVSFEVLLSDYLEGNLDGDARGRVTEHLQSCLACSSLLDEVRLIRGELGSSPKLDLPESLVQRILAQTSGRERPAFWPAFFARLTPPVATARYAFTASVLFAFLSLMVNVFGAELWALGPSHPAALALVEKADRLSGEAYKQWIWLNHLRSRATLGIHFLEEDLRGRFDSHLLTIPFQDYADSLEELRPVGGDTAQEVDSNE